MKKYGIGNSVAFTLGFAANMELNVSESRSIVTVSMTGNGTIALADEAKPVIGDEVIIKASSDDTARTLTFGDGFTAPALAGTISKTKVQALVYDGDTFVASADPVQID